MQKETHHLRSIPFLREAIKITSYGAKRFSMFFNYLDFVKRSNFTEKNKLASSLVLVLFYPLRQ